MTKCTPTKKARIYHLRKKENKTFTEIGDILGIDATTVSRNFKKLDSQGKDPDYYSTTPGSGRPRALTPHDERRAERLIKSGKCRDATEVQRELFPKLHPTTVRRMFLRLGLKGRLRRKKPLLTGKHIKGRRNWAMIHQRKSLSFWKRVCFSDESKFNLFGSDGKIYCRRREGEALLPRNVTGTVKHGGGNIMVWGCITWNGVGRLHRVEGRMKATQYCNILETSLLGSISDRFPPRRHIIFQQDNDPKHTSKLATKWFQGHNINVLPWPGQSPDMNIIEHVWDELDRRVRSRLQRPSNLEGLWTALQEEWKGIDQNYIRRLYKSLPLRVQTLSRVKGHYTKY